MNKKISGTVMLVATLFLLANNYPTAAVLTKAPGKIKITFLPTVNHRPIILNEQTYTNPFGETYSITKLKYYISNVVINASTKSVTEKDSYHLIDAADTSSLSFTFLAPADEYTALSFVLGVDSSKNVSGAQTGALDPANDMFWTWNSGYVMAKLEGISPVSTRINNKIEFHIGGYKSGENVIKKINFPLQNIVEVFPTQTTEIIIEADINQWWQHPNAIRFSTTPICTTPGALAQQIAENYSFMFSIKEVIYQ